MINILSLTRPACNHDVFLVKLTWTCVTHRWVCGSHGSARASLMITVNVMTYIWSFNVFPFWSLYWYIMCVRPGLQYKNRLWAPPSHSCRVWLAAHVCAAYSYHPAWQVEKNIHATHNNEKNCRLCCLCTDAILCLCVVIGTWPPSRWCFSRGQSDVRKQDNWGTRWEETKFPFTCRVACHSTCGKGPFPACTVSLNMSAVWPEVLHI